MRRLSLLLTIFLCLLGGGWVRAQEGRRLDEIEIVGRLVDPKDKLIDLLGVHPCMAFDQTLQQRISDDLRNVLGYNLLEAKIEQGSKGGVRLRLQVEPIRVVRKLRVVGNWPLFDDEILRHLTLRSGSRLKPDEELAEF